MKQLFYIIIMVLLVSCTSNTIYKKPKDLIPKDTMISLITDLYLAKAAKSYKNQNLERRVNYLPLVYDKYKIDSVRFKSSNIYYSSKVDEYNEMFLSVETEIERLKKNLTNINKKEKIDSPEKVLEEIIPE